MDRRNLAFLRRLVGTEGIAGADAPWGVGAS